MGGYLMSNYDREKVDEVVLALMSLTLHDSSRAWKGFDWDTLDRLYEKGWIDNPRRKTKSVQLKKAWSEQLSCLSTILGHRSHSRRPGVRRTMRMSFDLNEPVFDEQGTYLEEPALRYEHALMEQFAASPEGQAIRETGTELGWAGAMIHYAINYPGVTPPTMTPSNLEEVVYDLFPRKVITEKGDGAEIIQELRAFWHFLQRVYQLPQANQMLARLTPQAARRLERALQEPTNFGMAKSFVLMGKQPGFDMESPKGMQAWVKAYNATVAPADPVSKKKSRGAPTGIRSAQRRKRKPTHPHERREP